MKPGKARSIFFGSAILLAAATFISFTLPAGGDSLEIYLDKKLVLQQFMYKDQSVKTVSVSSADQTKQLDIHYRHCGMMGKSRMIMVKDDHDKLLKEWHFDDGQNTGMTIAIKDIPGITKGSTAHLYYHSKELPQGKLLVNIISGNAVARGRAANVIDVSPVLVY